MSPPTAPSPPCRARGAGTRRSPATPSAPAGPPEEPLSPRPRAPRTSPGPRGTPQSLQRPPLPLKVADRTPTGPLKGPFQPLGHPELSVPRRTPRIPTQHHGDTHGTSQNFTARPHGAAPRPPPDHPLPVAALSRAPSSSANAAMVRSAIWSRRGDTEPNTERGTAIRSRTRSGARRGAGSGFPSGDFQKRPASREGRSQSTWPEGRGYAWPRPQRLPNAVLGSAQATPPLRPIAPQVQHGPRPSALAPPHFAQATPPRFFFTLGPAPPVVPRPRTKQKPRPLLWPRPPRRKAPPYE